MADTAVVPTDDPAQPDATKTNTLDNLAATISQKHKEHNFV